MAKQRDFKAEWASRKAKLAGETGEPTAEELEVRGLRQANVRLQARLSKAEAKVEDLVEAVYEAAFDAAVTLGNPPAVPKPAKDSRRKGAEVALVHLTDWQFGKVTEDYSPDVAVERIGSMARKVARLTEIQRASHPVRKCHVLLGGDMIEGVAIFPGQAHEIEMHLFEQMMGAAQLIEDFIRRMLSTFEEVEIDEVIGNHGRLGRKGDFPRQDNVDRMVYRIVRERFKAEPRLKWNVHTSWHVIVKIGAYRALLVHGDQIKSFGGNVPAYGIMRKFNAWSAGVVDQFHDGYLGHMHQTMELTLANGGRVFMTGSPESSNEYAREFVAAKGRPSQRLHFVDPTKGRVTAQYVCWLD